MARKAGILSGLCLVFSAAVVQAYDGLTYYGAEIGPQDHFNSQGQSLGSLREVLRQDRANYHLLGKRDRRDQNDGFFRKAERRGLFDKAQIRVDPKLERDILNGKVTVITVWVYSETLMEVTQGLPAEGAD